MEDNKVTVKFSSEFRATKVLLLEPPDADVLKLLQEPGTEFVRASTNFLVIISHLTSPQSSKCYFKGSADEEIAFCTGDHTFSVKQAETSNSVLLFDTPSIRPPSATAVSQATFHYELKPIPPNYEQLKRLLSQYPVDVNTSEEDENTIQHLLCTTEQLESRVQASSAEILAGLNKFEAFIYKGKWRVLSERTEFEIVEYLYTTILAEGWQLDAVPKSSLRTLLMEQSYPSEIVDHILALYLNPSDQDTPALNIAKLSRTIAVQLLQSKPRWPKDAFELAWADKLPEGTNPSLDMLKGFVVYDESSGELQYFPASRLPLQPQARFKDLFATKQRWSFDEIQPYLADLVGGSITEQQLLLQHSRTVISKPLPGQKESVKMYSAR